MALTFAGGAATDRVNFGSGASLDNLSEFTVMEWVKWAGFVGGDRLFSKDGAGNTSARLAFSTGNTRIRMARSRATTNTIVQHATIAFSSGVWYCVFITAHATVLPRLYQGTLTEVLTEDTYSEQQAGSGTLDDDSADDFFVGNESALNNSMDGAIAFIQVWNKQMTMAECQRHQFQPTVDSDTVLQCYLGYNGTGTQPDWSGNGNSGTVTGATVSDHVPLGLQFGFGHNWMGNAPVVVGGLLPRPGMSGGMAEMLGGMRG